jgi:hypothetical protein
MSVVGGALVSAFGGLLVLAGVKQLFTAVSVSRSENVPVRNVASRDGLVEFDGRAEAPADEGAFEAPFSGEEALYCDLWMKAKSDHGSGAHSEGIHLGDSEPHDHDDTVNANDSWGLAESGDVRQAFVVEEGGTRVSVDPEGASFDIEGHMGESVLGVGEDSPLSEEVRDRLARLDEMDPEFDGSLEKWENEDQQVQYREARLEPGDSVHVANGRVESAPDGWGTGVSATVGTPETDENFMISEGTESSVIWKHLVQFATGTVVGGALLALGLHAAGVVTLV